MRRKLAGMLAGAGSTLSGGDLQRVAIGRPLVRNPKAMLMDEPTGSLDAKLREEMQVGLKRPHVEQGSTTVYVTHDQIESMSMGTRTGVLNNGALVQVCTPSKIYIRPVNDFVARAVGLPEINLRLGRLDGGADPGGMVLPLPGSEPGALLFGVRSEDLDRGGEGVAARVTDVENHGVEKIVMLPTGAHRLRATAPVTVPVSVPVGDGLRLGWNLARVQVFASASGKTLRV